MGVVAAAAIGAVATVGTSVYTAQEQKKAQKKAQAQADEANRLAMEQSDRQAEEAKKLKEQELAQKQQEITLNQEIANKQTEASIPTDITQVKSTETAIRKKNKKSTGYSSTLLSGDTLGKGNTLLG